MKCPIDQKPLQITERQGVEIDYCPECRGVWLDRGELDKIIERVEGVSQGPSYSSEPRKEHGRGHNDDMRGHGKRRKESLLGELFDF